MPVRPRVAGHEDNFVMALDDKLAFQDFKVRVPHEPSASHRSQASSRPSLHRGGVWRFVLVMRRLGSVYHVAIGSSTILTVGSSTDQPEKDIAGRRSATAGH